MSVSVIHNPKRNLATIKNKHEQVIKKKHNEYPINGSIFNNPSKEVTSDCTVFKIINNDYNPQKECLESQNKSNNICEHLLYDELVRENITILVTDLLNKLRSGGTYLVDLRDVRMFKNGHIKNAELLNCTTRAMMQKAKKHWRSLSETWKYCSEIVLYNQKGDYTTFVKDFVESIRSDFYEVSFLKGGYEEFIKYSPKELIVSAIPEDKFEQYHFSPTNESSKSIDVLNATMTEILPFLYLGNEMDSNDIDILQEKKITHILNVTNNVPFYHEKLFTYKRLSATDCNKQDMRAYYSEANNFIDEARSCGGKVLVHCWAGVSRSATIVAAYILNHTGLDVMQTVNFLQSKRTIVEPNFNFLGQLQRYFGDLENGVDSRSQHYLVEVERSARKLAADLEEMRELRLSSNSSSSNSPNSPPSKPYFNFIK